MRNRKAEKYAIKNSFAANACSHAIAIGKWRKNESNKRATIPCMWYGSEARSSRERVRTQLLSISVAADGDAEEKRVREIAIAAQVLKRNARQRAMRENKRTGETCGLRISCAARPLTSALPVWLPYRRSEALLFTLRPSNGGVSFFFFAARAPHVSALVRDTRIRATLKS